MYGNATVTMIDGHVRNNVYGGGYLGSVGKGNYASGSDDYYPNGYGEKINTPLFTEGEIVGNDDFMSSGNVTVTIKGGTVGTKNGLYGNIGGSATQGTPTGMVFGGSRGQAAQDVGPLSPRYAYAPDFFLGYVNNATVNIGKEAVGTPGQGGYVASSGPTIYSQVFGGGRDGHVRGSTHVIIWDGAIGQPYDDAIGVDAVVTADYQRYHRGNVYGSGSGLGTWDGTRHGTSSGSVTRHTRVDIYGGIIYNNVYGGGAMSSVGPPKITKPDFAPESWSKCTVNIYGGTIGITAAYEEHGYGGCVFGASRGGDLATYTEKEENKKESADDYATTINNVVNIMGGTIAGSVYGGGQAGRVKKNNEVHLTGGDIAHDAFGGGKGTADIAADVGGNATVVLNEGKTANDKGCSLQRIFGCNDLNGTPRGHVKVHVHATRHPGKDKIVPDGGKYALFSNISGYSIADYSGLTTLATGYLTEAEITTYTNAIASASSDEAKNAALKVFQNAVERAELQTFATSLGITTDFTSYSTEDMRSVVANEKYDMIAVYGGGNLALYQPNGPAANGTPADYKATEENTEVIIDGCNLTSIRQVYGGGNAASTPANSTTILATYEIDELFGGGNGKDPFLKASDNKWFQNPGAYVGYYDYMEYDMSGTDGSTVVNAYVAKEKSNATQPEYREANYGYGAGVARTDVIGGRIHNVYGGSNEKGNIRTLALSVYETSTECPVIIDKSYGAGKNADIDGEARVQLQCVEYMAQLFGGSTNADVRSNVNLTVTNGHFGAVYGGNDTSGHIYGSITVTVKEEGCKPIIIDNLYGGDLGVNAPYSIYGYYNTGEKDTEDKDIYAPRTKAKFETDRTAALTGVDLSNEEAVNNALLDAGLYGFPKADPAIHVISATRIGNIYGGGNAAKVIGSPHINVNMEEGHVEAKYVTENADAFSEGLHEVTDNGSDCSYFVKGHDNGRAVLAIGTIGNIFGGGNMAEVDGNTHVEIGTGTQHDNTGAEVTITPARNKALITESVYGGGNSADVTGNSSVTMGDGAMVYNRIYGGGNLGNVGTLADGKDAENNTIPAKITPTGHTHTGTEDCIQKPNNFKEGTGKCTVDISGGRLGPFTYSNGAAKPKPMKMYYEAAENGPDDYGYVFGASRGDLVNPDTDPDIDFRTYVDNTEVTVSGKALIAGGVYGGSENGRVLHDTNVYIQGGQIGIGAGMTEKFIAENRDSEAYTEDEFIDPATTLVTADNALAECEAWPYRAPWAPYDQHATADASYGASGNKGSDGHTFYGNVFGGGSGYFSYKKEDGSYEWLPTAGMVEGDTYVEISGGHILTSVYGGNEMTDVHGTCHVKMTGGTLGVPRTLAQIAAHPVTCYLFGAGKGDTRVHFNKSTDVGHADIEVSGGIIYGSVFGGGEDGHVMGNVTMNIKPGAWIGTWGTSYVDGNIFGGGRGFTDDAYTAGNVAGSVTMNITGGTMLGSIYGGGRLDSVGYGLYMSDEEGYGEMRENTKMDDGSTAPDGWFPKGRGHIEVNISGGTIGNKYEFVVPTSGNIPNGLDADFKVWTDANWTTWKEHNHVPYTDYDPSNARLTHTKGGNVFTGGMGRRTKLNGDPIDYTGIEWKKLGNVKSTKLTVSGNDTWIMGNVYGGGEFGAVTGYHNQLDGEGNPIKDAAGKNLVAGTEIVVKGGTIGTEITGSVPVRADIPVPTEGNSNVSYTFGSIYGGGMGDESYGGGAVADSTIISMSGAGTKVRASVFGGGEQAIIGGSTSVTISGGKIGRNEVMATGSSTPGNVMFGGATMGNVYGGGKGSLTNTLNGQVKGNATVLIQNSVEDGVTIKPEIYHMVYGGGALGSVGDFKLSKKVEGEYVPSYIPAIGIPYGWEPGTGTATVTITGGTIGISGRDNGLVFGSSRGGLQKPVSDGDIIIDPYDKVAWVNKSVVNIGTKNSTDLATPHIKGSLYGGGENGHNDESAEVNVYSGTIGITALKDPWYSFIPENMAETNPSYKDYEELNTKAQSNRGNVYGAGSGSDTYTSRIWTDADEDGVEDDGEVVERGLYNHKSGMVAKHTTVNIKGGHVGRSVYGGGAMAMVGTITNVADTITTAKHRDENSSFALSWPYKIEFAPGSGKATVNITGGHIGTRNLDGGDVYGSSRGTAGDRYITAHMAYVNETEVNINYPTTIDITQAGIDIENDFSTQCVTGSVHGSGEDGYVYGDTHVTLNGGLIGHSLYGGGKGAGTYEVTLNMIGSSESYKSNIYSLISGKVMGNTYVTMTDGQVLRNVYGGGNIASVGKGNYSGGADDYSEGGYGETITGNLWTSTSEGDDAWQFLNSGKTNVKVLGGTVGYMTTETKEGLPYGNVIGGSRGEAAPNVPNSMSPRYKYCPAFFSGYVNETDVTIGGGYKCKTEYTIGDNTYKVGDAFTTEEYNALAGNKDKWEAIPAPTIYASVYGGGQDGHVRRDTKVTVYSGKIGLPYTAENQTFLKATNPDNEQWLHRGNVYGAGSGISKYQFDFNNDKDYEDEVSIGDRKYVEDDYSTSAGSVTRFTQVEILGGTIYRNVYGGGSLASVGAPKIPVNGVMPPDPYRRGDTAEGHGEGKQSTNEVIIGGLKIGDTVVRPQIGGDAESVGAGYGGNVFGASRGDAKLNENNYGTSIWTKVFIKDGAKILGNVFGGGDNGLVKKDAKVIIGEKADGGE